MIERAVLLRQENDVIEYIDVLGTVESCSDLLAGAERQRAGLIAAVAAPGPSNTCRQAYCR